MRRVAALCYRQHGGSGTNLTYTEVMGMEWSEMEWWLQWLEETRQAESEALRDAQRSK